MIDWPVDDMVAKLSVKCKRMVRNFSRYFKIRLLQRPFFYILSTLFRSKDTDPSFKDGSVKNIMLSVIIYYLFYICLHKIASFLINCYINKGSTFIMKHQQRSLMELAVISNFHHRRSHRRIELGTFRSIFSGKVNSFSLNLISPYYTLSVRDSAVIFSKHCNKLNLLVMTSKDCGRSVQLPIMLLVYFKLFVKSTKSSE